MSDMHDKVQRWMDAGYSIQFMSDKLGRNPNYVRQIMWQVRHRETYDERLRERYKKRKQSCSE